MIPTKKKDDLIALNIATAIAKKQQDLVPGNHLEDKPAVVHYSGSTPPATPGWSLGDWAPVKVEKEGDLRNRPGCPVITVEVYEQYESWAFIDGEQYFTEQNEPIKGKKLPLITGTKKPWPFDATRSTALQLYADALISEFLLK